MEARNQSDLAGRWRTQGDAENPAGPLFIAGEFAEADIICETGTGSGFCGTICTGSIIKFCC